MTTLDYVLVALLIFEIFFSFDLFKRKLRAETSAQRWFVVSIEEHRKNEEKDAEIVRLNERLTRTEGELSSENKILRHKFGQCQYLCDLLDQHGIEWESGWRKLYTGSESTL
jgi:hypothetical protein